MAEEQIAKLALEDGTVFEGASLGSTGTTAGEVVFNTSMTGYQEILTDPRHRHARVGQTYSQRRSTQRRHLNRRARRRKTGPDGEGF